MGGSNVGGLFDKLEGTSLTKPALVDSSGKPTYYSSNDDALNSGTAKISASAPTVTVTPPSNPQVVGTTQPMPDGVAGPPQEGPPALVGGGGNVTLNSPSAPLPMFKRPTYQEASTNATTGMPQANTPGLTKAGKLLQVLSLAAKGAMAGQAASNQAVIQSGGHRSGGVGIGFMAGLEEPEREAMMSQAVQHGALANQLEQANINAIPALRAATLAHTQAETNSLNQHAEYLKSLAQIKDKDKLQQMHADAVQKAISEGRDPQQDPEVQAIQDAITSVQHQATTNQPHDELSIWRQQHPNEPIENYWKAREKFHATPGTENEYRDFMAQHPGATVEDYWQAHAETPKSAVRGQFAAATVRKNTGFRNLQNKYEFLPATGEYRDKKTYDTISPDEFTQRKQAIQDQYEQEVADLTGNVPQHVDIPAGDAQPKSQRGAIPSPKSSPAPATPAAQGARKVGDIVNVKGQRIKITAILPNGKYQGVPAGQ